METINIKELGQFKYDEEDSIWWGFVEERNDLVDALKKANIFYSAIDMALTGDETGVSPLIAERALSLINKLPEIAGALPGHLNKYATEIGMGFMLNEQWQLLEVRIAESSDIDKYTISFGGAGDKDTYGWWTVSFNNHSVIGVKRTSY